MTPTTPVPFSNPSADTDEREYRHWNRVYIAVILFDAVVIIALWIFSNIFTP